MKLRENWYVDAPWAQLVCSTEMPDDVTEKILELSDNILKENQQDPKDEDIVKAGGYRGDPTKETASYNWLKNNTFIARKLLIVYFTKLASSSVI